MKISVVIPNYNGENLLRQNLPKVIAAIKNHDGEKEIIVTDDVSIDQSKEVVNEIKKEYKDFKITFLEASKNRGFSSNVNGAVHRATGEIIILLNTDVSPNEDFLKPLLKNFKDKKVFAVGCLERSIESDGNVVLRGRGVGSWKRGFLIHQRGEVNNENTLWVSGGSGAFRKEIWDKLRGFNSLYDPFYWEDIDLSYRALKSGYKVLFEPDSVVKHEHEKGAIKSRYSSSEVKEIAYRNQFIFTWLNLTDGRLLFLHCAFIPYHLIKTLLKRDFLFVSGFFRAFILFPKILKCREQNMQDFIISDYKVTASLSEWNYPY
jgi:GT2 family glycosyltransferase